MTLADTEQQRMVERLRATGAQSLAHEQVRAGGIDFPAVVLSEHRTVRCAASG